MKLLAIETATEACSAAVLIDDEIIDRYELAPRKHNELILPMCQQVLSQAGVSLAELDAIAFGCGPGAFTGVRIAASVTQGIAIAHDLPVIPVSTLENLASQANAEADELIMPAIDARMDEIYWAIYKMNSSGLLENYFTERVQEPALVDLKGRKVHYALGSGWKSYSSVLDDKIGIPADRIFRDALPTAKVTVTLAKHKFLVEDMVTAENALPVYLRNNVVHNKK